jgi:hypothetical protein
MCVPIDQLLRNHQSNLFHSKAKKYSLWLCNLSSDVTWIAGVQVCRWCACANRRTSDFTTHNENKSLLCWHAALKCATELWKARNRRTQKCWQSNAPNQSRQDQTSASLPAARELCVMRDAWAGEGEAESREFAGLHHRLCISVLFGLHTADQNSSRHQRQWQKN